MSTIRKILIANRGEIAVRVMKTARRMGIRTVAVYSRIDAGSLHVTSADEAWCMGGIELSDTYLNIGKLIGIARQTGCDAIHPGYGFLSENPLFVEACREAGLLFIGPDAHSMQIMGNKIEAREFVKKTGIPMTAGVTGSEADLLKTAATIGFPVLLKAAAGGGGKGMQIVFDGTTLAEAIESASRQAKAYFGDPTVYIEKYIEEPRHIEVQILGDQHGNIIHLFERECSIQRRYQKIIEESPSPTLTPEVRRKMGEAAVRIGKEIGYINAGTIEFLVDKSLNFYFLEMNTRIQVEHPVTEMVTGIDIVEEQIRIAEGNRLRIRQEEVIQQGHAIECRIYAEDPMDDFRPSPGMMTLYREPEISGIRIDTGTGNAMEVNSSFDPMIAKLIVKGRDRNEARNIMAQALNEYVIHGIATNIAFLERLLRDDAYISNAISTGFCDTHLGRLTDSLRSDRAAIPTIAPVAAYLIHTLSHKVTPDQDPCRRPNLWETIGYWRNRMEFTLQSDDGIIPVGIPGYSSTRYEITLAGEQYLAILSKRSPDRLDFKVGTHRYSAYISEDRDHNGYVSINGHIFRMKRTDLLTELITASQYENPGHDSRHITSPMPGKVIRILVKEGEEIKKGQPLIIIEAMKMENTIVSPGDRVVKKINAGVNDRVETTTVLIEFEE